MAVRGNHELVSRIPFTTRGHINKPRETNANKMNKFNRPKHIVESDFLGLLSGCPKSMQQMGQK